MTTQQALHSVEENSVGATPIQAVHGPRMTYRRSDSLTKLAPALVKVMGAVGKAAKSSTNPHFRSKYADLATCHEAALPALEANGFSFPMFPFTDAKANTLSVTGLLLHESGEFLEGTITIPLKQGANAQDVLAAETYARRGLYCVVGVVPDDDDDGETAVGRGKQEPRRTPPEPPQAKSPNQVGQAVVNSLPSELKNTFKPAEQLASRPASVPPEAIVSNEPITPDQKAAIKNELIRLGLNRLSAPAKCEAILGKGKIRAEDLTMAEADQLLFALRKEEGPKGK